MKYEDQKQRRYKIVSTTENRMRNHSKSNSLHVKVNVVVAIFSCLLKIRNII